MQTCACNLGFLLVPFLLAVRGYSQHMGCTKAAQGVDLVHGWQIAEPWCQAQTAGRPQSPPDPGPVLYFCELRFPHLANSIGGVHTQGVIVRLHN